MTAISNAQFKMLWRAFWNSKEGKVKEHTIKLPPVMKFTNPTLTFSKS